MMFEILPPLSHAWFLVPLLATAIGVSEVVAGVIVAGVTIAASVGVGLLTTPKPKSISDPDHTPSRGTDLEVKYGGSLPRAAHLGRGAVGGHLVYTNTFNHPAGGVNNGLQAVFVIGDGLHGKMLRMWINGKLITLPADLGTSYYAVPEFMISGNPRMSIAYYKGAYAQAADPFLVSRANPSTRWTANHMGRGVAYVIIDQIYDEQNDLTHIPDILCETEGLALYDPRLDDTNGGVGPHRWGQVNTYAPSNNPAIQEYNFRRGITVNGVRILGMTVAVANLDNAMYFAAANVCDESVNILPSGTEPRYRCSIGISDDRPPSDALSSITTAMAGMSVERGGRFGAIAGAAQALQTELEFTDDDLLVGQRTQFSKWRTRSEIVTAVHGRFSDPDQKWSAVSFAPRINITDDAIIGERLNREIDLTQIFSTSQAERVAEIERRRTLQLGKGTVVLPIRWIAATPGDWVRYNSVRHGDMTVLITGVSLQQDFTVVLTYEKIATTVYTWGTGDQGIDPGVGIIPGTPTLVNQLTGVTALGISIAGTGGVIQPAIRFDWNPVFDPSVTMANFEVRVQASPTQVLRFDFTFPAGGFGIATAGIQDTTIYEYRYKVTTFPERATVFSAFFVVTSGTQQVGGVAPGVIDFGAFASSIEPVAIVSVLPNPVGYTGPKTVFLTTDRKLYRYVAAPPSWTVAVAGQDIVVGSIGADRLVANSITAGQIAVGAIGADEIAANAVIAGKLAAGSIYANTLFVNDVIIRGNIVANTSTAIFSVQVGAQNFAMDNLLHLVTAVAAQSIGGQYIVDFSTNINWDIGYVTLAGTGTFDASQWSVFLHLFIDGVLQQTIKVTPYCDAMQIVGGVLTALRFSYRGHFRGLAQVTMIAGARSVEMHLQSQFNKVGYTMWIDQANIVCFEARR